MICLISDISVGNFDSDCESDSQSPIFTINKNIGKPQTNKNPGKQIHTIYKIKRFIKTKQFILISVFLITNYF